MPFLRWALLVLLVAWPVARFLNTSALWLEYPYPRSRSEGLILHESLLVKQGASIYAPITPQRFISASYPPIYYWLAAAVLPTELPDLSQPGDTRSMLQPGRIISLLATLLTAALLSLIVLFEGGYTRQGRRAAWLAAGGGAIGGLLFLYLPPVMVWATRFHAEMLSLALTAGGLVCVAASIRNQMPGVSTTPITKLESQDHTLEQTRASKFKTSLVLLSGAAMLFSVAFFTAQAAISGPIAAGAYLLLRDWRVGLRWCLIMLLMLAVPFALFTLVTGGGFYLHMVDYHLLPLRGLTLARLLGSGFWEDQWPLMLVAGGYILLRLGQLLGALLARTVPNVPLLIPLFALTSFVILLPSGAMVGADHNALLMPGLAICACVGGLFAEALTRKSKEPGLVGRVLGISTPVAVLLLTAHVFLTSWPSGRYSGDLTPISTEQQEQMRKIVLNVRQHLGDLYFSDDPGLLALAGKETPYNDPFTMTKLAEAGRWDEGEYRRMLREGKFGLVLLRCDVTTVANNCHDLTFTEGAAAAMRDGYRVLYPDLFYTYEPKGGGQ